MLQVKHGKDAFLLLSTDGLNFVLSDQEVVDIVVSCSDPAEAAVMVTDQALQFGSEDNTSTLVIPFGAWGKYRTTTQSIPYSFGRNLFSGRYS
jgi:protein phosphatase 1K